MPSGVRCVTQVRLLELMSPHGSYTRCQATALRPQLLLRVVDMTRRPYIDFMSQALLQHAVGVGGRVLTHTQQIKGWEAQLCVEAGQGCGVPAGTSRLGAHSAALGQRYSCSWELLDSLCRDPNLKGAPAKRGSRAAGSTGHSWLVGRRLVTADTL